MTHYLTRIYPSPWGYMWEVNPPKAWNKYQIDQVAGIITYGAYDDAEDTCQRVIRTMHCIRRGYK